MKSTTKMMLVKFAKQRAGHFGKNNPNNRREMAVAMRNTRRKVTTRGYVEHLLDCAAYDAAFPLL